MRSEVYLPGYGISGFRSYGEREIVRIGPLDKIHLLAGVNNAGKSNALAVLRRILPTLRDATLPELAPVDVPLDSEQKQAPVVRISLAVRVEDEDLERISTGQSSIPSAWMAIALDGSTFVDKTDPGLRWFEFEAVGGVGRKAWASTREQIADIDDVGSRLGVRQNAVSEMSGALTGQRGGAAGADASRVLGHIVERLDVRGRIPSIASVDAFRQIVPAAGPDVIDTDYNGPGLIERLARLQSPTFDRTDDRRRFEKINAFIDSLFDEGPTAVEIPHDPQSIVVNQAGRRLPLENFGTGLHEAVILAAAATVLENHVVCIEEPEVHLHPTLQRKLLRYLHEETSNQYVIATHSAHLLDAARASISSVSMDGHQSRVKVAIGSSEIAAISRDLGNRASDLVQANSVIWVEGPSDRVYIRGWLKQLADDLVEGIHFSIMFYGGRLLRHLSPDDRAVEEFVSLPRINRNFAVVIDSDKKAPASKIGKTKLAVKQALDEGASIGPAWITAGYTIENYVPSDLLGDAVTKAHPGVSSRWSGHRFVNPLAEDQLSGSRKKVDKVRVAEAVIENWTSGTGWRFDLRERVDELVSMVRTANDL